MNLLEIIFEKAEVAVKIMLLEGTDHIFSLSKSGTEEAKLVGNKNEVVKMRGKKGLF